MQRRKFLRHLLATPVAASAFVYGMPIRLAQAATGKTLVVIFQRGGCDGLNTVIPYGDNEYYNLRGNTIAVPAPDSGQPRAALDLDGFFGLHPSLAPFYDIYQENDLAIFPAVHFNGASRSHFVNQDIIESGAVQKLSKGWLNRHLVSQAQTTSAIRSISFGSKVAHSLRGSANVTVISDLNNVGLGAGEHENDLRAYMQTVYARLIEQDDTNRFSVHKHGNVLLDNLDILSHIEPSTYTAANGAVYPASLYGKRLRQAAQLIKENIGLEVVTINMGGWDHHTEQGGGEEDGKQSRLHAQFSQGINALYTDLGSLMDNVMILTMTEFGRTAKPNGNEGTDHGHASAWFAIGHNIKGGIYGTWPGLLPEQLYKGRFLAQSIDYRDVLGEIVTQHLENDNLAQVLPDHTHYQPIGFLS